VLAWKDSRQHSTMQDTRRKGLTLETCALRSTLLATSSGRAGWNVAAMARKREKENAKECRSTGSQLGLSDVM